MLNSLLNTKFCTSVLGRNCYPNSYGVIGILKNNNNCFKRVRQPLANGIGMDTGFKSVSPLALPHPGTAGCPKGSLTSTGRVPESGGRFGEALVDYRVHMFGEIYGREGAPARTYEREKTHGC